MNNTTISAKDMMSFAFALPLAQGYADLGLNGYNRFAEAFQRSQDDRVALRQEEFMRAIAPAMVLAFATEIYAKVLIFQRTGTYPRGHQLTKLVRKMPPDTLVSLTRRYNDCVERPGRPLKLTYKIDVNRVSDPAAFVLLDGSGPLGDDFEKAIAGASPLFEQLRYLHEEVTCGFSTDIDFSWLLYLLDAIRSEVLQFQDGEVKITVEGGVL
jgi:hypothetical protein